MITTLEITQTSRLIVCRQKSEFVQVAFRLKAGNQCYPKNKHQLGHLLEHLALCGSEYFKDRHELTVLTEKEQIYANAFTNDDEIVYYMNGRANQVTNIIDLLFAMTFHPLHREEDFEAQKKVIEAELRMYASDSGRLNRSNVASSLFDTSTTIQEQIDSLSRISYADIKKYHTMWHVIANCDVYIIGNVSTAQTKKYQKYLQAKFCSGVATQLESTRKPRLIRPKRRIIEDYTINKQNADLALAVVFPSMGLQEFIITELYMGVLATGSGSRMMLKARKAGLVYTVFGSLSIEGEYILLRLSTQIDQRNLLRFLQLFCSEFKDVFESMNVSQEELARAKGAILNGVEGVSGMSLIGQVKGKIYSTEELAGSTMRELLAEVPMELKELPTPLAWRLGLVGGEKQQPSTYTQIRTLLDQTFSTTVR